MPLLFGIPTLDELIDAPGEAEERRAPTTFAVIGPDGTGKTALALHLASRYHFDCLCHGINERPLVIYVSSDMQFAPAIQVWEKFGLDQPGYRQIPFERTRETIERYHHAQVLSRRLWAAANRAKSKNDDVWRKLHLRQLLPLEGERASTRLEDDARFGPGNRDLLDFLDEVRFVPEVGFLDLAGHTAGDDWSFVNILLGKLSQRPVPTSDGREWPHLVIIDSVAGFETFVGELDVFGQKQSRRTRIAQCIRHAGQKCHLGFIVEETKETDHQPEEFVTDVVIRLRKRMHGASMIRTVEVEKARARNMALGEHPFEILPAHGTSTGNWENPDHPRVKNHYITVHHSLAHRNLVEAARAKDETPPHGSRVSGFGVHYLDRLLARNSDASKTAFSPWLRAAEYGLNNGGVSALIGDFGTGKTLLADRFLAEGFRELAQLRIGARILIKSTKPFDSRLQEVAKSIDDRLRQLATHELGSKPSGDYGNWEKVCNSWRASVRDSQSRRDEVLKQSPPMQTLGAKEPSKYIEEVFQDIWPKNKEPRLRLRELLDKFRSSGSFKRLEERIDWNALREGDTGQLDAIFDLPQFQYPALLMSTRDIRVDLLAGIFVALLQKGLRRFATSLTGGVGDLRFLNDEFGKLPNSIEEQIILRRFEIGPKTAASLFHLIQQNVVNAQLHIYQLWSFAARGKNRFHHSDRIRLVIDDLGALAAMCPDVANDTSFLPYLTFYLERQGITSLLVYGDAVRPDRQPEQGLASRLRMLVRQTIMLWPVPFEGETRIALTVVPSGDPSRTGVVRQLIHEPDKPDKPDKNVEGILKRPVVSPSFELYSGIEEGKPKSVPLAIYLYAETPAFKAYIESEDLLFREQFVSTVRNGSRVLVPIDTDQVAALREFSMLPMDTKYDHTIVFQVDNFWVLDEKEQGALVDQTEYLFEKLTESNIEFQDPFRLFRGESPEDPLACYRGDANHHGERIRFFVNKHYSARLLGYPEDLVHEVKPNRVPFMWDFGFLLLRHTAWAAAAQERLDLPGGELKYVWQVQDRLCIEPPQRKRQTKAEPKVVPWRAFLAACQVVARRTERETGVSTPFFDFASPLSETLNCLILEMWMSEIYQIAETWGTEGNALRDRLRYMSEPDVNPEEMAKRLDLAELLKPAGQANSVMEQFKAAGNILSTEIIRSLPIGSFALYKVWLLLIESIDVSAMFDSQEVFNIRMTRTANKAAVAARHWYKTACEHSRELRKDQATDFLPLPVRLPGHYSTRGDWFLASPSSSRSELLGRYAIDLLSSRRANFTRMQLGMGLPTRDVVDGEAINNLRTALVCKQLPGVNDSAGTELKYVDLCKLAARSYFHDKPDKPDRKPPEEPAKPEEYYWLWRSSIKDYDRMSRPFQKWIARMLRWTIQYRRRFADSAWDGGFKAYDELSRFEFNRVRSYDSFVEFGDLCDLLRAELQAAQRRPDVTR